MPFVLCLLLPRNEKLREREREREMERGRERDGGKCSLRKPGRCFWKCLILTAEREGSSSCNENSTVSLTLSSTTSGSTVLMQ